MFSDEAPRPWKTKKGHSRLDYDVEEIARGEKEGRHHSIRGGSIHNHGPAVDLFASSGNGKVEPGAEQTERI